MKQPPKLAQRLLYWRVGKADVEDIIGDMEEVYHDHLESEGTFKADLHYWYQVISV